MIVVKLGVITEVLDFVVPESLPAGSDMSVRVQLRNTGTTSGYVFVNIEGNPDDPDTYVTVETGTSYPTSVPPGGAIWLDISFRYFKMPNWGFKLTASNEEGTSLISRTIALSVGIPTITTITVPEKTAVNERFYVSGILYERDTGVPTPGQPINVSYNGKPLGGATTGVDGDYLLQTSIPESGVWTLKADFPGTPGYAASTSMADMSVEITPIAIAIQMIAPLAVGLTLTYLGIRGS